MRHTTVHATEAGQHHAHIHVHVHVHVHAHDMCMHMCTCTCATVTLLPDYTTLHVCMRVRPTYARAPVRKQSPPIDWP